MGRGPGKEAWQGGAGGWNHTLRPGQGTCRAQSAGAPQGTELRTRRQGWPLGSGGRKEKAEMGQGWLGAWQPADFQI